MATPWLDIALAEEGTAEYPGPESNQRILEYIASTTYPDPEEQDDSRVPWCSCFVNWCVEQAGLPGTKSAAASSWREWGEELEYGEEGCVVVMTRPGGNHVGFYMNENDYGVLVLGGNQGDRVSRAWFSWDRITNFKWPDNA